MADDVIVIGGGIVGASAAYTLARRGARVTLVDRADNGQATAAGAGIISPGTSTRPLLAFFQIGKPASAYYPELLAMLEEDGETSTGYEVVGLLHVAMSDKERGQLAALEQLFRERRSAGFEHIGEVTRLSGDEARPLFPALGSVMGAIHTSGAARMDGRLMRDALRRAAQKRRARILIGDASLVVEGDRAVAVAVDGEQLLAGAVIVAGGAWSSSLGAALGQPFPVSPQRGQILHLTLPNTDTSHWPIVVGFHSHYLLTFPTNRVVAGATRESQSGYDVRMTAGGVYEALGEALRVAPGLAGATIDEIRIGLRPASPDGLPLLGKLPAYENVFLATGHGPSGLQLGPYSGAVVAALALGENAPIDLTPFAPGRFVHG